MGGAPNKRKRAARDRVARQTAARAEAAERGEAPPSAARHPAAAMRPAASSSSGVAVPPSRSSPRARAPRRWFEDEAPPPRVGPIAEDDRWSNARRFADALYNEREREQRKPLRRAGWGRLAAAHELFDESYTGNLHLRNREILKVRGTPGAELRGF